MNDGCAQGLVQAETQHCAEPFVNEGYPDIKEYARFFFKNDCMVCKAK